MFTIISLLSVFGAGSITLLIKIHHERCERRRLSYQEFMRVTSLLLDQSQPLPNNVIHDDGEMAASMSVFNEKNSQAAKNLMIAMHIWRENAERSEWSRVEIRQQCDLLVKERDELVCVLKRCCNFFSP